MDLIVGGLGKLCTTHHKVHDMHNAGHGAYRLKCSEEDCRRSLQQLWTRFPVPRVNTRGLSVAPPVYSAAQALYVLATRAAGSATPS